MQLINDKKQTEKDFDMITSRHYAKRWCFTLNNPIEGETFDKSLVDYIVVGDEVGEKDGTRHFQGYVHFKKQMLSTQVKKLLPRAHWEVSRGTPDENAIYCKKSGRFMEYGQLPLNKSEALSIRNKRNWDEAFDFAKQGRFCEIDRSMLIQYYHAFKRIRQDYPVETNDLDDVCGIWYWGAPGVGKSYKARTENPDFYDKPLNKWWDGYQGQETIILDDVGLKQADWIGDLLKRWADRYSFPAEQKGTTVQIRPKKIIVTSNYRIETVFAGDQMLIEAIKRRFRQIQIVALPSLNE